MDVPSTSEQLPLLDDSADDCREFVVFKQQLEVVMKVIKTLKQKVIDITLTVDDLIIMDEALKKMTEYEEKLPPNKMKSQHVPYRALSLKMIQESYRLCDWLIQKQCNETDNLFTPESFIDKVCEAYSGKEDPIDYLNTISKGVFRNTDNFCLNFIGNFKPVSEEVAEPVKLNKQPQRQSQKRQLAVQIVPDEVVDEVVHNEVDDTLVKVQNCLKRAIKKNNGNPIPFFKFIIDPLSLTYSVENLFYLSSLVKDGVVKIENGDDNFNLATLVISKKSKTNNEEILQNRNTNTDKKSFLFPINHDLWMHYVKKFNVTERMIDQE